MTLHAARLLRKLKKAQQTENNTVFIDGTGLKARTQPHNAQACVEVSLKAYKTSLIPTLKYLDAEGLVEYRATFTQVTSKGWHYRQELAWAFCAFLAKSVLVPIIVSLATSVIMNLLW